MPRSLPPVQLGESQDLELAHYRVLTGQVVVGFIFGLLSPAALLDPMLWFLPPLGLFFCVWALRRIKTNPSAMAGRKRALFGLTLSLISLVAAPTEWYAYRYILQQQARQVADTWFKALVDNRPTMANSLMPTPRKGAPAPSSPKAGQPHKYAQDAIAGVPAATALLAMGSRARVRFYQTEEHNCRGYLDVISFIYAVTYEEKDEKKSFFVSVSVERDASPPGPPQWHIARTVSGYRPPGF